MLLGIVADVLEMLGDGLGNTDLAYGDAQRLHQLQGVIIRAVGGAEAGHGDADDAAAVEAQLVESLHGDKQRQRGVETAADADNGLAATDMVEALGQTGHLNVENLVAGLLHLIFGGDEGMRVDGAHEFEIARTYGLAGNAED